MKKINRVLLVLAMVLAVSFAFGAVASADFTYWYNDGSSAWAQLHYTNDEGAWALPIYQNSFGDVFDLSDVQEIQVVYLNR
ncbi:hypothetical protein [Paenibacillus sp. 1P07SE]|uniref:hypothetical protein n=1 Tax=Paenibacillus sp. 1P07SE TaxID=3132209 RepID=UPI0039A4BF93